MKKRLLSMLLTLCLVLTALPVSAFAAESGEALYAQMLELGLVDENGSLIQDNSFTAEDGTWLSSLDALVEWLNCCGENDLAIMITVDATGRTATVEQLLYALAIEYQMADLSEQLNLLSSGSGSAETIAVNDTSGDVTAHDLELRPTVEMDSSTDILTFEVLLYDKKHHCQTAAPHDIRVFVGAFADFLQAYEEDYAADGTDLVPGSNYFKEFTLSKGQNALSFRLDLGKLRSNYLSNHEGLWDGNAFLLLQARTFKSAMPDSSIWSLVKLAPQSDTDAMVGAITGDTLIGKKSGGDIIPYHLDWSQHDSATEKVTIDGTDYFKINTAIPSAKGSDANENPMYTLKYGWMDSFSRALQLGVGNPEHPAVSLKNVTIWTKEDRSDYPIGFPKLYVMDENGDLERIAKNPTTYRLDNFEDGSDSAAYLADLARVQQTDWDYANPNKLNFYQKIKSHTWNLAHFSNVEVPVTNLETTNSVRYSQDWYLNADWITQNKNGDLRPEELLIHGALTIADQTAPTVASIDTCAYTTRWNGNRSYTTFAPGNLIPIVVTFSEPVYGDYELVYQVGTNQQILRSAQHETNGLASNITRDDDSILSNTRVFYYTVPDTDCTGIQVLGVKPVNASQCKDVYGNAFQTDTGAYQEFSATVLDEDHIQGGRLEDSFRSMTATVDPQDPTKVTFQVNLSNAETFQTKWLQWSTDTDRSSATVVLDGDEEQAVDLELGVIGEGSQQEYVLTGTMTLPPVNTNTSHMAELYFGTALSEYTYQYGPYAVFTQTPVTYAGEDAYTISVQGDGWPSGMDRLVFLQDAEVPVLGYADNHTAYTYQYLGGQDVTWESSNPEVVQLSVYEGAGGDLSLEKASKVSLVPLKAGTATISLRCGNHGKKETTASNSITVTVKDSGRPSLLFPKGADTVYAQTGVDQTVRFASNLSGYAPTGGMITAALYAGSTTDTEPVWKTTLARSASGVTIPGSVLTRISLGSTPTYLLRLTASAEVEGIIKNLSTQAHIIVRTQPAVITLSGLDKPTFTSGQAVEIGWTIENFDLETNPDDCQFQFTVEKDGTVLYTTEQKNTSGSYTLALDTPKALKDYYIVTAKAKNGTDPTWSIDSSTLTVYRKDALKLLVGGEQTDTVTLKNEIRGETTTDPAITAYTGETIRGLTSAQSIAALRSELSLMESIGINVQEYDWSILYDAIQWSTSTGEGGEMTDALQRAVTINYREGSLYAPLEQYSYTCYLPQTLLLLCGLRDGSNTITAAHNALPDLRDSVQVHVETLRDKLYLFQFTPAVKTEVTYEDGAGQTHTVSSNEDGSMALFEPNGIASQLQAASVSGGTSYRGTVSRFALKSGEGNGTRGELYPLNTVELRRAAAAQMQLLRPDGTPLANTEVTLRGGVYRNRYAAKNRDDAYCSNAKFAKASGQAAALDGTKDQIFQTDENGVLTVHMDLSQFTSKQDPKAVGVGDSLEFIFELRTAGYYPEIVTVDGSLTQRDAMRSGEDLVTLTTAQKAKPFMAAQTVSYTGREIDVRRHTGVIGPSSNYPSAVLESTLMLWGVENASLTDTDYRFDLRAQETGVSVPKQTTAAAKTASYPFSSIPLISNTVTITSDSFASYDGTRKTTLEAALFKGGDLTCTIALPFGLADLTTIEKVEDAPSVTSLMANLAAYGTVGGANTDYKYVNKVSDGVMLDALSFLEKMGGETGLVKAVLMPTEDPTRYEAYLWTGINTTKLEDLDYDRNGISLEPSYIGQDYDSLLGQVNDTFTLSDFQAMADGSYFEDRSSLYGAASGAIGMPIMLQLEGWMSTEIRYNFEKGQWQVLTTGGGFTAGAQLEFEKILNGRPYGIPLTASFKVRGGATVDFQTAIRYAQQLGLEWKDETANAVNDYLTALRINAYFEFFGGIGYDKGFTAKVGVFGSIEINNENRFLTRKYLKDPKAQDVSGQFLQLDGEAGIRAALGVGPLVTEITLVSLSFGTGWSFNDWENIRDYWESTSSGLGSTGWLNGSLTGQSLLSGSGQTAIVAAEPVVKLQSRAYLAEAQRTWSDGGRGFALFQMPDHDAELTALETNAYPFSAPQISDDGALLVYLSDADSSDVADTEVRYSRASGGGFPSGTAIPTGTDGFSGYGDSSLDFDGTENFAAAIWLREAATVGLKAGSELNDGQQTALLNGLEVMASIWDGSKWTTTRLTENGSQEFDPVIAVNDAGQAIAVWRAVQTDENAYDFAQNRILCKLFDGNEWSEEMTLYNGSAGEVTGMSTALLADGTAAVAFSVKDAAAESEIYYTVMDTTAANPDSSAKTVRATTNSYPDENPQLCAIDGQFVLGWTNMPSGTGAAQYDIGLWVFDKTGSPQSILPESLSDMVSTASFDGKFTFVKGADSLETLSILWNDANAGDAQSDVIRAVKFFRDGDRYLSSAAMNVAQLPERTGLDSMDAYAANRDGTEIRAVVSGTTQSDTDFETVSYAYEIDGTAYSGTGRVPKETTNLYRVSASYTDAVEVVSAMVDYSALAAGSYVPVSMTISNQGMHVLDRLTVTMDGAAQQTFSNLQLLPGQTKTFSVITKTESTLKDLNYKVEAGFSGAGNQSATGTVYLDYPDIGISALTVTREQDGQRTVLASLYNQSAASLCRSDRRVKLGVYSDPECQTPLDGKYFSDGTAGQPYERMLTGSVLEAIDNSGSTQEISFSIGEYVNSAGLKEIPDDGVTLFVKAQIQQQVDGEWITLPEADSQNNQKHIVFDSLLRRNENAPTTLSVELENGDVTTANVQVRNHSLQSRSSGNLIAALLDQTGALLETKNLGNFTLSGEEIRESTISFSKSGARVVLRYGETTETANANAASITLDGLPLTMASFDESGSAAVSNVLEGQYLLTVIPESTGATVTINGKTAENGMASVSGGAYERTVTITITAADGVASRTYTIHLLPAQTHSSGTDRCTLRFATNGGSELQPLQKSFGTTVDLTAYVPERSGFVFSGWYADAALTQKLTQVKLTGNTTVYAGWKTADSPSFADVPSGSYYADAVRWAVEENVTKGTSDTTFTPNAACTRAQAVIFLWRMAGSPAPASADMIFTDVTQGSYYHDAVLWAMEQGITKGTSDTMFTPDAVCTRAQIVTFLWRWKNTPAAAKNNPFTDVAADRYYTDAVLWAAEQGITSGTTATTFSPNSNCTRAQIVTFLWRSQK